MDYLWTGLDRAVQIALPHRVSQILDSILAFAQMCRIEVVGSGRIPGAIKCHYPWLWNREYVSSCPFTINCVGCVEMVSNMKSVVTLVA